jgi:hypothetical protein
MLAEPFQAAKQSANAGWMPLASQCRWYLSLVQFARDGLKGHGALCLECANSRSQSLGSRICGLVACKSNLDPALGDQTQARKHPPDGGAMPATAKGGRYSPSVQFIRKLTLGNEASRHKLPNGRRQSSGAGVCGPLAR